MVPNRLHSAQGKFTLDSGFLNSNKTRLMATPMMSAEIKKTANVTKNTPPNIDSSTVKKVFSSGVVAAAAAAAQKPPTPVVTPFHIENSSLAKGMWCKEDKNGAVSCDYEDCEIDAQDNPDKCKSEFEIQDIYDRGYYEMIGEDYWGKEWDESHIYKFEEDPNKKDDFVPFADVIQMALADFDRMVFCCQMIKEGFNIKHIRMGVPEFKKVSLVQILSSLVTENDGSAIIPPKITFQDYNQFDVQLFYDFCRKNPFTDQSQDWMYPFVNLENVDQKEMDKYVIGAWIENHMSDEALKTEITQKIQKEINKEIADTLKKQKELALA